MSISQHLRMLLLSGFSGYFKGNCALKRNTKYSFLFRLSYEFPADLFMIPVQYFNFKCQFRYLEWILYQLLLILYCIVCQTWNSYVKLLEAVANGVSLAKYFWNSEASLTFSIGKNTNTVYAFSFSTVLHIDNT